MNVGVCSTTFHETGNGNSLFPAQLRDQVCEAVQQITVRQLKELGGLHETAPSNLDGTIEANLRSLDPALQIRSNSRVSPRTRFNADLVIETDDAVVSLEVEKGKLARFELDILKMQAFAFRGHGRLPDRRCFGAFIVPADNVVARHISGNARESSFQYLRRLSRLVLDLGPTFLRDILVVGYDALTDIGQRKGARPRPRQQPEREPLVSPSEEVIARALQGYPARGRELVLELRRRLKAEFRELREKYNPNSRYLGYAVGRSDALYVYLQKSRLVLDVRVPEDRADELSHRGIQVVPRSNYQARDAWLTGVRVPHDTDEPGAIVQLAVSALRGQQTTRLVLPT